MKFDSRTWAIIPLAVAINFALCSVVSALKIPLYLDSLGTILVACLAGPAAGALTGAISNTILAFSNPIMLCYLPVSVIIGWSAGYLSKKGFMTSPYLAGLTGVLLGILAAGAASPVSAFIFKGTTGSSMDLVVAGFRALGLSRLEACLAQGLITDPLDKTVSCMIIQAILASIPLRLRYSFPQGESLGEISKVTTLRGIPVKVTEHGERQPIVISAGRNGLYYPGDGLLHKLSPGSKIWLLIFCITCAFTLPVWLTVPKDLAVNLGIPFWLYVPDKAHALVLAPYIPFIAALIMGLAIAAGSGMPLCKTLLVLGLPISISMVAINGLLDTENAIALGNWFSWSFTGAFAAFQLCLRLILILEGAVLLLITTRPDVLLNSLERNGLHPKLAYIFLASLYLFPNIVRRANEIIEAQTARAMPLGKGIIKRLKVILPLTTPLILGAIMETEERALALEARGFGTKRWRTYLDTPAKNNKDTYIKLAFKLVSAFLWLHYFVPNIASFIKF